MYAVAEGDVPPSSAKSVLDIARPALRTTCPLCGHGSAPLWSASDRNHRVSARRFPYRRCCDCRAVFLAEPPANLGDYYPPAYYALVGVDRDLSTRFAPERYKLDIVQRHQPAGRLLEVGTGTGGFLHLAARAGYQAEAIEQDRRAARWISANLGCVVHVSDSPADVVRDLGPFDVVALWHSLEHMEDPWNVLEAMSGRLAPGGIVIVATPNPDALQFKVLGRRWAHVDPPRHSVLIPSDALARRMASLGLRTEAMTTTDAGGKGWDRFGWQMSLRNLTDRPRAAILLRRLGRVVSLATIPLERSGRRGSTYTAVFRRPA